MAKEFKRQSRMDRELWLARREESAPDSVWRRQISMPFFFFHASKVTCKACKASRASTTEARKTLKCLIRVANVASASVEITQKCCNVNATVHLFLNRCLEIEKVIRIHRGLDTLQTGVVRPVVKFLP